MSATSRQSPSSSLKIPHSGISDFDCIDSPRPAELQEDLVAVQLHAVDESFFESERVVSPTELVFCWNLSEAKSEVGEPMPRL